MKKLFTNAIFIFLCITNTIAQLPSYVPANGLVGYWPFNGNANDESGNNNNGTANGAILTADRLGNNNKAYSFDGVNDYISLNNTAINNTNSSVAMWVKTTPSITSSYQCFFYEGVPGEYHMASGATGVFGLLEVGVKGSNNSWQGVYFNLNNSINIWQHFVFNYSNNVIDLYINGQFFGSASNTSGGIWSPTLDQTNFGARRVTGSVEYPFNGSLDDIGIWNRALTPSEITALYQSQNCNLSVTSTQNNITLNGGNNGSASVNVSGGTAPYTYSWSPSGGTNSNATGLIAGSYTCNITDANSCSTSTVVTITQPAPTSNCFPSYVPANGLVGWWPFCGNANDESGNGHNGIVNGATATVDRFGNVGQAYNFDGVNDRISINHNASFNFTNNLTVSIWSKVSNFGPNNQWLIDKGLDASPGLYNWGIASIAPGNFVSLAVTNTGDYTSTTVAASNTGIWNMWTYVYDGASIKLYKNDSIVINEPANGNLKTNTEPISVGYFPHANMPPYGYFYNGQLDDIGIWNRVLTACEINQLYTSGVSPIVASSTSSTICAGANSTLTANGATSYTWMPGNFTGTSLTVAPSVTTIYTVTGTNANGCINTATTNVVVNTLPIVTAASSASAVCAGNSVTLSGGGASSYVWSSGVTNAISFVPTINTTYTVTGTDANGCSKTATTNVVVNTLPVVTAASSASAVCAGNSVTLSGGGASSYVWSSGVTNAISFVPTINTTYTVTGTDANGCSKTATTNVVVNTLPVVTAASSASAVCAGNSVTLSGGGASSYVWSNGVTNAVSFIPTTNTTYTVTGTDVNGCSKTATTSVVVNALPVVTAASSSTAVCAGNSITLSGGGASAYVWSNGVTNAVSFVPTTNTTYTVTGTDVNGCSKTATTSVVVNALPVVTAASSSTAVCAGNSVTLSGGGASNYVWSNGVTNAISFIPTSNSTYTVTGTDLNGCLNTATTNVVVNTLPVVTAASSASAVCAGNSVTLSGGGASSYVWSSGVTNAISFIPTNSATYTVTGTDANGCSNTATTNVVVNTLPIVTAASSASAVCAGNSITLSGGGASTYNWTSGVTDAVNFVPTNSATYTVTGTDANGCSNAATTNIVVNTLPIVTAASSASAVCAGSSVTLSGGGASSYVWSSGVTNAISFVPTTNTTYTVTGTDANGCSKTATTNVVVNTLPIVTAASSASAVCAGSSVTLSGGGASSYVWSSGVTNAISFVPTTNTTYTVTGTDANGCSKTATTNVVVNTLPIVTAASSASAVCAGSSVTLSGGGASSYVWSNGVTNAVSFIPTTNTTYTVTGTDVNGCSKTATTSVVVNALPVVTAASSSTAVCAGNSITLSGGGASVYVWSNGVTNAVSFIPTTNTTYTVTGTDVNGCSKTATTSVVVNALPIVTAASSASAVCAGNSVTLSGGGASTYVWSNGVTDAISFIPTNSATYTVTGTDGNGCSNTATTNVVVNTLPVVTAASSASAVCAGNSVTLSGGGASTYVWSNGVTDAISFIPTNSATYTVTGTDGNGCSNTATTNVVVNTLPVVTAASSASAVCAGNSVTLSGGGASTYSWSSGVTNAVSFVPTTNTTYTVTGTDGNGCSNTATTNVVVNTLPIVTAASSASVVCAGNSVNLSGGGASSYVWSNGVTDAVSFIPTTNTTYTVTGTDANGCANTAATGIVVNELPIILVNASSQIYCLGDLAGTLSANPTGGFWSGTGITGNSFDPSLAGFGIHNSIYSYTDVNGCVNSDTLIMSVNLCTGVNEITTENLFTVYPNPVSTEINIKANISFIGSNYTIYDATGKLVLTGKINSENTLIELGNLSGGIYLLNVGDKTTRTFKVVKE